MEKSERQGRKRRPGGGRKPTGRVSIARQVCLPAGLWDSVDEQAKACGMSRSAWIRRALEYRLGMETGIW